MSGIDLKQLRQLARHTDLDAVCLDCGVSYRELNALIDTAEAAIALTGQATIGDFVVVSDTHSTLDLSRLYETLKPYTTS